MASKSQSAVVAQSDLFSEPKPDNIEAKLAAALTALDIAESALTLVAAPMRPDGTYNRDRAACRSLADDALKRIEHVRFPKPVAPVAPPRVVQAAGRFTVHSDGACKGNPGPAAWGVVIVDDNGVVLDEAKGYLGIQTNNVAEIEAACEALRRTPVGSVVTLYSDSQYTLKSITEWRPGWERNNWLTAAKEPVKNQKYLKALFALVDERKVTTRWVKGHSGDPFNERCDALANEAIAEAKLKG